MAKRYTVGEIFRLGLLKSSKGEPYSDKATVSRIVKNLDYKEEATPWGMAKTLSKTQIEEYNRRWES